LTKYRATTEKEGSDKGLYRHLLVPIPSIDYATMPVSAPLQQKTWLELWFYKLPVSGFINSSWTNVTYSTTVSVSRWRHESLWSNM